MIKKILPFVLLLALPGCTVAGFATGLGASAGASAAQEGGISRALTDARIQAAINDLWFRYDIETFSKLDLTVNQGRVLITGVMQDPAKRVEAVRLAWQPAGVKQVINEIRIAEGGGIIGFARDNWITTQLRAAITLDRDVQSINYNIDTVQGTVYLMGVAQSQAELNRVIETARTTPDVKAVVSYVKFVGGDEDAQDSAPPSWDTPAAADSKGSAPPAYEEPALEDRASGSPGFYGNAPTPLTPQTYQGQGGAAISNDGIEREEIEWQ